MLNNYYVLLRHATSRGFESMTMRYVARQYDLYFIIIIETMIITTIMLVTLHAHALLQHSRPAPSHPHTPSVPRLPARYCHHPTSWVWVPKLESFQWFYERTFWYCAKFCGLNIVV